MAVVLRGYRRDDLEALWRLDEACFTAEFRFDRATMRRFVERRGAIVVVAEDEAAASDAVCGFVIVHLEGDGQAPGKCGGYVVTLDVAAGFRRRGLALQLMEAAAGEAAARGAVWMWLHVFVGNAGAIAFYERTGYERGELIAAFYGPDLDALVFRRWLGYGKEDVGDGVRYADFDGTETTEVRYRE